MNKTIYCVMWRDTWVVVDGDNPEFLHSAHATKRGAHTEAKRMRAIARQNRNQAGKITTTYTIQARALLT